ncbi:hypothetical protein EYF80_065712 [Liparis tanakae]|uniref:Uncharacterized protein n=1 Tax=Liparis tanakae TaxID=230148 RepID=A0A4Z2E5W4_9TELE|nr:hypothetical protein EYF80_065712 [Liparis tanakae]
MPFTQSAAEEPSPWTPSDQSERSSSHEESWRWFEFRERKKSDDRDVGSYSRPQITLLSTQKTQFAFKKVSLSRTL